MSRNHSRTPSGHDSFTSSPPGSGLVTPSSPSASSSFIGNSLYSAFGGLMRRFSSDPAGNLVSPTSTQQHVTVTQSNNGAAGACLPQTHGTSSPMQPPPLDPVVLNGHRHETPASARLLSAPIAEEIRIMVPERLRIEEHWNLVYSLDQDGASLATLYEKCDAYRGKRGGFVLAVRDDEGGTFGAYLSEAPHPSSHYFGTGECFLWRASLTASLPPPPSADATDLLARSTTVAVPSLIDIGDSPPAPITDDSHAGTHPLDISAAGTNPLHRNRPRDSSALQPSATPSVRFKAFPYSGVNEYYAYCEHHWLSIGAGDGKYGLWLDDGLERGVSSTCLTFGNEPLSDQGEKFHVLGVEVWVIGAKDC